MKKRLGEIREMKWTAWSRSFLDPHSKAIAETLSKANRKRRKRSCEILPACALPTRVPASHVRKINAHNTQHKWHAEREIPFALLTQARSNKHQQNKKKEEKRKEKQLEQARKKSMSFKREQKGMHTKWSQLCVLTAHTTATQCTCALSAHNRNTKPHTNKNKRNPK